jgi:hypothetical protein
MVSLTMLDISFTFKVLVEGGFTELSFLKLKKNNYQTTYLTDFLEFFIYY